MNQKKVGVCLGYLLNIGHAIIGFLYVPILLYYVGKNDYGLYQLIGSLIAYLSIIYSGMSGAIIRFYTKYRALSQQLECAQLLGSALRFYGALLALLVIGSVFFYSPIISIFDQSLSIEELEKAKILLLILLLNMGITMGTVSFRAVIMSNERFVFLKGIELLQLILQPLLIIALLQKYPSVIIVTVIQTVLNFVLSTISVYYCFHFLHIKICWSGLPKGKMKDFVCLSIELLIIVLIEQFFYRTSQIVLGKFHGTGAVAIFSIATIIYMNYRVVGGTIMDVFVPHITSRVAKKASAIELSEIFIQIGRMQYFLLLLVLSGFILFGKQFILLWVGKDYSSVYWLALVIMIPMTISLIQGTGMAILQAKNQLRFFIFVFGGAGVSNLILSITLGKTWGEFGCAGAMGTCLLINTIIMDIYYRKKIHINIVEFLKQIGEISVAGIPCVLVGNVLNYMMDSDGYIAFAFKILIYTATYCGIMWIGALNETEKNMGRSVFCKIK